jgi:hypothetical protein
MQAHPPHLQRRLRVGIIVKRRKSQNHTAAIIQHFCSETRYTLWNHAFKVGSGENEKVQREAGMTANQGYVMKSNISMTIAFLFIFVLAACNLL